VWNSRRAVFRRHHFYRSGVFSWRFGCRSVRRNPDSGAESRPGRQIQVPVVIDSIGNLAGMKLVIGYDKQVLAYKSPAKAKAAASPIHVVNSPAHPNLA
jgi:hypothetical protein